MDRPRFSRRCRTLAGSAVIAAGAWVVYTFPPSSHTFYPRCWFHAATGLDCPGCGGTRALHQLLHGDVLGALALNPLLFVLLFGALVSLPSLWRGEQPPFVHKPWFGWASVVVLVGFWVGRNLV